MTIDNQLFEDPLIARLYAQYAQAYHDYKPSAAAFVDIFSTDSHILEIGSGTGQMMERLLVAGYNQIKGIDRSRAMLSHAPTQVQSRVQICDLLEYNTLEKFDCVFSHSGGFTSKDDCVETYYQEDEVVDLAVQKVYALLGTQGKFLINRTHRPNDLTLADAKFKVEVRHSDSDSRRYTYTFAYPENPKGWTLTRSQRRKYYSLEDWQEHTREHFSWDFTNDQWLVGSKI